ncbi:hypothetical protein BH11ARM1_BH11ARM1_05920 [soil metagenome]
MKRVLSTLVGVMAVAGAMAQAPADVPQGHWASKAVSNLYRLGVLKGYPDGQFRGARPVSRYELAVAIQNLYGIQGVETNRLQSELNATKVGGYDGNIEAIAQIRARLDGLEANLKPIQELRPQIDDLQVRFEKMMAQLHSLHEDVNKTRESIRSQK